MKTYLTEKMIIERYGISPDELNGVEKGSLNGTIIFLEDDIKDYLANRIDREQFHSLEDTPILLSDAARKYGFHIGSLARWVEQGHIRIISTEGNYRIFLNEADVAYARALADARGVRSGRPLFRRKKE
jgi:hypothetical protein